MIRTAISRGCRDRPATPTSLPGALQAVPNRVGMVRLWFSRKRLEGGGVHIRVGVLGVITLTLVVLLAGAAAAHVDLVRIEVRPPTVPAAAPELVLEFSARLDRAFSTVQVLDAQGRVVEPGPGTVDESNPILLLLPLDGIAPGDYQAAWRVRSQDGHVASGDDRFTIAAPPPSSTSTSSLLEPTTTSPAAATTTTRTTSTTTATSPPTTSPPGGALSPGTSSGSSGGPDDSGSSGGPGGSLWEAPLRWLSYLSAAVLIGVAVFLLAVWRLAAGPDDDRALNEILRICVRVAGVVLLLSSLALILVQAAYAADVGVGAAFGQPLWDVLGTYSGRVWIARFVLVLGVLVTGWTLSPRFEGRRWWVILAGGLGVLLTFSLVSHASTARHAALSIGVDWVHLVATTAWIGGLVALTAGIVVLRRRSGSTDAQARVVRRFSGLAVTCVVLLAFTGLYGATQHFSAVGSLFTTTYGRVLLVKLALFGILLLFGAANRLVLMPRMAVPGVWVGALMYTVPAEVAVGTVLLFVVGVLTGIMPG